VDTRGATLRTEGELDSVAADETRFHELLGNLFRNSVEHAGEDVQVQVGRLPDGDGIYVANDGPGIPHSVGEAVFEHGYSTNEGGTGYGLSIVDQVASAHGWEVTITEGSRDGTRFEVTP
jgi:signal transduction histidine kinase